MAEQQPASGTGDLSQRNAVTARRLQPRDRAVLAAAANKGSRYAIGPHVQVTEVTVSLSL